MAERDGLENRCTLTGTEGSNPSLSANNEEGSLHVASFFLLLQLIKMPYFEQRDSPLSKNFSVSAGKISVGDAVSSAASAGWRWPRLDGGS